MPNPIYLAEYVRTHKYPVNFRLAGLRFTRKPLRSAWKASLLNNGEIAATLSATTMKGPVTVSFIHQYDRRRFLRHIAAVYGQPSEGSGTDDERIQRRIAEMMVRTCHGYSMWEYARTSTFFHLRSDPVDSYRCLPGVPLSEEIVDKLGQIFGAQITRVLRAEELLPPAEVRCA